jgi:hypothetical protein
MTPAPVWESDSAILDEGLSVDGLILFVVLSDRIQGLDPQTGALLGSVRLPGASDILDVSEP